MSYRMRYLLMLERDISKSEIRKQLGPAPWELLNDALAAADFPYRIASPLNSSTFYHFFTLTDDRLGIKISPNDLSSGEKMILQLVLWLFNSNYNKFPKLLLMDEPDAHLHPFLTIRLLSVLSDVLVNKYGCQIIMSTHSPSTIALAPDDSIFEMKRADPVIRRPRSKDYVMGLLSAGLLTVSSSTKFVLVEDEEDVYFFSTVRDILSEYGQDQDRLALDPAPSVVFMAASLGKGINKAAGGKHVVAQWVDKFDLPPLSHMFSGIIDLDDGNVGTDRIQVIGRYSIENYLLDPLIVLGLLVEDGRAPMQIARSITQGNEHRIRLLPVEEMQEWVAMTRVIIEPSLELSEGDFAEVPVEFSNGVVLKYPRWMLSRRGKDLLVVYQKLLGGPSALSPLRLRKMWRRVRLVPKELAQVLHEIQSR